MRECKEEIKLFIIKCMLCVAFVLLCGGGMSFCPSLGDVYLAVVVKLNFAQNKCTHPRKYCNTNIYYITFSYNNWKH